jgi:LPS sulfotransferase NodH
MRGYAICTEPRSGSTLLCRLLESTGVLGRPMEFFNPESVKDTWGIADYPLDAEGQIGVIPRLGATPNGVYGVKVFSRDAEAHVATRWMQRLPGLSLIYLERVDMLGQAISHVRAAQTRQWAAVQPEQAQPYYDRAQIMDRLTRLGAANARWRLFFARNGLRVLTLFYEQITQTPQGAVDAVALAIGVDGPVPIDPNRFPRLTIQRDALNEEWRGRFVSESRDLTVFP